LKSATHPTLAREPPPDTELFKGGGDAVRAAFAVFVTARVGCSTDLEACGFDKRRRLFRWWRQQVSRYSKSGNHGLGVPHLHFKCMLE
jgi:hypothetical protein